MIDKIYIDEAIRIRKEYLINLNSVKNIDKIYEDLLSETREVETKINKIDSDIKSNPIHTHTEEDVILILKKLYVKVDDILEDMKPYEDKLEKLNSAQSILYKTIKTKYPNITDEQIHKELLPLIIKVDEDFD